jgi:hypothetical protein
MNYAKQLVWLQAFPSLELSTRENAVGILFRLGTARNETLTIQGCGNAIVNGGGVAPNSDICNMACYGNSTENCGGSNALNVYQYTSSTSSATAKRGLAYNNNNPDADATYANLFSGYSSISWGYDWGYPSYGLDSSFEL